MALVWTPIASLKGPKGDIGTWWQRNLAPADVLDDMRSANAGLYGVLSAATAESLKLPIRGASSVEIQPVGVGVVQIQRGLAPLSEVWQRELYGNGVVWGGWHRTDHHTDPTLFTGLQPATPAGFKSVGIPATVGFGGSQTTGQGYQRSLQRMPATATRARIRLRNWNPRYNMPDSPAVALSGISVGVHNGGNSQSNAWNSVALNGSTGTDGYVSPWFTVPASMAGRDVLLAFGWQSTGEVQQTVGYGFKGALAADATTGTGTASNTQALFVVLEAEVPSSQPTAAVFGDSLASGNSASRVVFDSWLDQWARANGVIPTHWSHSGDQASSWADATGKKWTPYGRDVALADMCFYAMGSNTIFGANPPTLAAYQAEVTATVAMIRKHISPNIYSTTIPPRTGVSGAPEVLRTQVNAWLKASGLFRDVFDTASVVSTGSSLRPEFDADGIHLNTAGYAAMAAAITLPVVGKNQSYRVDESVGRVVKAWDHVNDREQIIYADTGLRQVALPVAGSAFLRRLGQDVTLYFRDVITPTGAETIYTLPAGFTPDYSPQYGFLGRNGARALATFTAQGGVVTQSTSHTTALYAQLKFTTNDPWPASLPGTAVGVIPNS